MRSLTETRHFLFDLRTQWKLTAFTFHSIKKNINRAYLFDSDTVCEPAVLVWTFLSSVICGPSLCKTTLATQATTGSGGWRGLERMMSNTFSTSMSKLSSSLLFGTTCRYLIKIKCREISFHLWRPITEYRAIKSHACANVVMNRWRTKMSLTRHKPISHNAWKTCNVCISLKK